MLGMIPIFIVVVFLAVVLLILLVTGGEKNPSLVKKRRKKRTKSRDALLKDASHRLAQNPKDPKALATIGDIYYKEESWEKAYQTYASLSELCATNQDIDEFEVNLRFGLSALKIGKTNEAFRALTIARSIKFSNFEVNFNLGNLEFNSKNFEKATALFQQARILDPEHPQTLRLLGHSLFRLNKYKEALNHLRKAIDLLPEDKETLFIIAECYYELGQVDQAIRIFSHLRADPQLGPNAALFAGTINLNRHQYDKASMDFEIGLRHQNIRPEISAELKYRLAITELKVQEIGRALNRLREIQTEFPNYRDVTTLIAKYQELNANKNLQIFLLSPTGDFVTLCRKITFSFFPRAKVKILNIVVTKNDWSDIVAEVETGKWVDTIIFRFIRTQGQIGELILRDLYSHMKEIKAGKGFCLTAGTFTEEARKFVEARLIDLIEGDRIGRILDRVDTGVTALAKNQGKG